MIRKHKTEIVPLTPQLAREFAESPAFKGERDLSQSRLNELRQKLDDGIFFDPHWATATCQGVVCRVNGQHSSVMLASCGDRFPRNLDAVISRYSCDDEEDLALLFEQFDRRAGTRSVGDVLGAHARIHDDLEVVSKTRLMRVVPGLAYALSNLNATGRTSATDSAKLIHRHKPFIIWAEQYVGHRKMNKIGVVAAMFSTWSKNAELAQLFWDAVRDETGETPQDPSRVLHKFLTESIGDGLIGAKKWDTKAYYVKSIHAWNAWRAGETTQLKYHPISRAPIAA